ncbi:hypothetical protein SAMN05444166_2142 [Singulisphaera sp. GP187]|nr:hypothetical protein SAMN05444166_2142 [Singulisphaera sp. GP187]
MKETTSTGDSVVTLPGFPPGSINPLPLLLCQRYQPMRRPKDRELTLPARLSEASEIHCTTISAVPWS